MGSFSTDTVKSDFSTIGTTNKFSSEREAARSDAQVSTGYNIDYSTGIATPYYASSISSEYSIVGINANRVPGVREAIRNYTTSIQQYLDGIDTATQAKTAFRGEQIETAVENYMLKVKEYSKALVSYLNIFSDKLQDVSEKWNEFQANMASNVDSAKASFGSGTGYTEQK